MLWCGRIEHIQKGCYYNPQVVDPIEIPYDKWIIAQSDPSRLLWSSDPIQINQQQSNNLNPGRLVHLSSEPPLPVTSQHRNTSKDEPAHDQLHEDDDDMDIDRVSLFSYEHVASGSRVKSTIHNLGLQCSTGNTLKFPNKHSAYTFTNPSTLSKNQIPASSQSLSKSTHNHPHTLARLAQFKCTVGSQLLKPNTIRRYRPRPKYGSCDWNPKPNLYPWGSQYGFTTKRMEMTRASSPAGSSRKYSEPLFHDRQSKIQPHSSIEGHDGDAKRNRSEEDKNF